MLVRRIVSFLAAAVILAVAIFFVSHTFAKGGGALQVAMFWKRLENRTVACQLCPRGCIIASGKRGFCRVRENRGGTLYSLVYGRPCSVARDPIEKCPFYHFMPGTERLSIATVGCNQTCKYCQNWQISQSTPEEVQSYSFSPESVVTLAKKWQLPIIAFTYTEPVVFYEYMCDIAQRARAAGLKTVVVTNGYINRAPLESLCRVVDAIKVDLKGFDEDFYRDVCGGTLRPVLTNLKIIKEMGVHLEIVNLVVPTLNDQMNRLREMCKWIYDSLGPDVPMHFTRFSPNYRLVNLPPTPVATLETAIRIARDAGLQYVYIGNVYGHANNNTVCPNCGKTIIRRIGFDVTENHIANGHCRFCGHLIPGVWN